MNVYRRSLQYFKGDALKIVISLALIALSTVLGLLWPFPLAILIDSVLGQKSSEHWIYRAFFHLAPEDKTAQVITLAAGLLALRLIAEVLRTAQTLINIRIGYNGLMRVRCDLFKKLQQLSLAYHKSQPQGDAIYRLSYDALGFQAVLNTLLGVLVNVITLAAMTWIMLEMNWRMTLIALGCVPFLVWTIKGYGAILKKRYKQAAEVDSQITTAIQRSVATIGLVQAFGREADEYAGFHSTLGNSVRVRWRLHIDEVVYWLILGVIFAISGCLIFGYGGSLVLKGILTAGELSIFLFYLEKLYDPLNKLASSGASLHSGLVQVERVFEVFDRDAIIKDRPDAKSLPMKPREVALNDVDFEYRAGQPVLRGVSVKIAPGQMVAFVGASGVGKTTLLNLLPRFYDPVSGSMTLDGIDARDIKIADLRKHVALVLQENTVLPTSVSENIAYGRPDASDKQIKEAAKLAGADKFIEQLEHKYDTLVSESGSNLSGGQRQRISIARALLTESPVIVLDEPTSALDPLHEQMIGGTLQSLKGLRTMILVSHRLSTVIDCDQIFVMDEGKIVEHGTHSELLALRGIYYEMAKHQLRLA
ncbi:MAG TPA: ABC transporter ATP-binding protein, partial [Tepidisphaeraceae bacterium]|nr:ABC transporter ATP-binding protein [Tepidisphaeraceae bacterium]